MFWIFSTFFDENQSQEPNKKLNMTCVRLSLKRRLELYCYLIVSDRSVHSFGIWNCAFYYVNFL
jgi:hypothetical protein